MLELTVTEVAHGGWCVGRISAADPDSPAEDQGKVVFVRHALPGERVRARVTSSTARFARADAIEILEPAPGRVEPPCRYARPDGCGGCDLQHATPATQRTLKAQVVAQQLCRIAGIEREVEVEELPGPDAIGRRVEVGELPGREVGAGELPGAGGIGRGVEVGELSERGVGAGELPGREVGVEELPERGVGAGELPERKVGAGELPERGVGAGELPGSGLGWRTRVTFAVAAGGVAGLRKHRSREVVAIDDCLIAHPLVREAGVPRRRWPGAQSVEVAVSPESGERSVTVKGRGRIAQPGRHSLTQHAAGRTWRVSNGVFWQVHPAAADVLAGAVLAALDPQPADIALDLYCGAGLFAGVLAAAVGPAGLVTGVESDVAAVRDARKNLAAYPQVRIHRGDATDVLEQRGLGGAGLAVLDPPRTGVTPRLIELLADPGGPLRRIAYVSCDPATLARDIAAFDGLGWQLTALRAFDAFPMTHHIECLATLIRR